VCSLQLLEVSEPFSLRKRRVNRRSGCGSLLTVIREHPRDITAPDVDARRANARTRHKNTRSSAAPGRCQSGHTAPPGAPSPRHASDAASCACTNGSGPRRRTMSASRNVMVASAHRTRSRDVGRMPGPRRNAPRLELASSPAASGAISSPRVTRRLRCIRRRGEGPMATSLAGHPDEGEEPRHLAVRPFALSRLRKK
jgi:hypothetical protein